MGYLLLCYKLIIDVNLVWEWMYLECYCFYIYFLGLLLRLGLIDFCNGREIDKKICM